MFKSMSLPVWILALALAACGDDAGTADSGGSGAGTTTAAGGHPLATLSADQLDDYIEVLKAAQADPDKSAGQLAAQKGWKIGDWVKLDGAVKSVVGNGGFDAMLERVRNKLKDAGARVAEYEGKISSATDAQRPMLEKALEMLKNAMAGWTRTVGQADALRAGGELVESRLAEIKAALGR